MIMKRVKNVLNIVHDDKHKIKVLGPKEHYMF